MRHAGRRTREAGDGGANVIQLCDGDCFPSIEAYHFGTGSVTELLTSRSKGPMYGRTYMPNCRPSNTGDLP